MNSLKSIFEKKHSFWDSIFPISVSIFLIITVVWVIGVSLRSDHLQNSSSEQTSQDYSTSKGGDHS